MPRERECQNFHIDPKENTMKKILWTLGVLLVAFAAWAYISPSPMAASLATICLFSLAVLGLIHWLGNRGGSGKLLR
jgi:hypothetical protein